MLRAHLDPAALAAAVGVDVKTVTRWLAGRVPHQRTRLAVADALGEAEADLWPQTRPDQAPGAESTAEVVAAYAHRADIPHHVWAALLTGATTRIDLLGYAYPFLLELLPNTMQIITDKPPTAPGSGSRSPTPTARTSPNATPSNRSAALCLVGSATPSTSANPSTGFLRWRSACTPCTCTTRCSGSTIR